MRPRKKNSKLPPCVYLSHGAYYLVRGGKWEPLGRDHAAALAEYARRVAETPKGGMGELIERVLAHIDQNKSRITMNQYRQIGRRLKKIMAEFRPDQVKPVHIAAIKVKYTSTPFYANRMVSVLRMTFSHALEWGLCESNPCIGVARHHESKRERYLTDAEFLAIREKAGPRLQIIMDLCYLTGQRISDVLRIRLSDLTDEGIVFRQGKTGAKLVVAWNDDLRAVVARAQDQGKIRHLTLLHNRKGKAPDYSTVKIQWDQARKTAGIKDARIHDMRAKALTDAKRQGHDPQVLAGHTDARMTARYIRLRETPLAVGPRLK
jgi:integrase